MRDELENIVLRKCNSYLILYHFPDIDECKSSPCKHGGICIDGVDLYTCQCLAGYTEDDCETSESLLVKKGIMSVLLSYVFVFFRY